MEPSDAVAAGIDAMARNDLEEAKRILESVTADDPSYNVALEQLGQVHVLQGDHVAAVLIYEQLVGRSRENPVAHTLLGLAYYRAERYGDAELAALRAIELDPGLLHARYHIGLYRLVRGDISGATLAYVRAMRFDSGGAVYADALHELERLHDSDPDQAGVHYVLALFANSIEHAELEIIELEHFLDLEPEGPLARRARSMLANARNR